MKTNSFLIFFLFISFSAFAQTKEINIYCQVQSNGNLFYPDNLGKLLPDSIRTRVLINPRKDYNLKNQDDVVLFMGANGWKIVGIDNRSNFIALSREIILDEPAWELYVERLKQVEVKVKK